MTSTGTLYDTGETTPIPGDPRVDRLAVPYVPGPANDTLGWLDEGVPPDPHACTAAAPSSVPSWTQHPAADPARIYEPFTVLLGMIAEATHQLPGAVSATFASETFVGHINLRDADAYRRWQAHFAAAEHSVNHNELTGWAASCTAQWGGWRLYLYLVGPAAEGLA